MTANLMPRQPDHADDVLNQVALAYAPLVDVRRQVIGTRISAFTVDKERPPKLSSVVAALGAAEPSGARPTFVCAPGAILDDALVDMDVGRTAIIEIPAASLQLEPTEAQVRKLSARGVRLAISGRPAAPLPPSMLDAFSYCVLSVNDERRRRASDVAPPVARKIPFIYSSVNDVAAVDLAFEFGAAAIVGFPLPEPWHFARRPMLPEQRVIVDLIRLFNSDGEMARINATFKRDPSLVFKLLRLVNAAASGLAAPVSSLNDAILLLGYRKLTRWLLTLLVTASNDANTLPLSYLAIRRGLFLEAFGHGDGNPDLGDEHFIIGAFSLLDRISGASFHHLFELVALSDEVTDAILHRSGTHGSLLTLTEAIERYEMPDVLRHIGPATLARCNRALLKALSLAAAIEASV